MHHHQLIIGGEIIPFYQDHDCLDEISERLAGLEADRFIIVTDHCVRSLHGKALASRLRQLAPVLVLSFAPGEQNKNGSVLLRYAERAISWGATRRTVVLTHGGGVPGNLGGLLAALLFRGVRLVHLPTTLVGMMDSVVSLKQAVNSRHGKNLIGTFYPPVMILADTSVLETLPVRELRAGVCEVIKNALAINPQMVERLRQYLNPTCAFEPDSLQYLLTSSLKAKMEVMQKDRCEKGRGLILEYGHTIGHAIELASTQDNKRLSHGEAVGIGMICAAVIAREVCGLSDSEVQVHRELLARAGVGERLLRGTSTQSVLQFVSFDNKRGYRHVNPDAVDMILLRRLGKPNGRPELPLTTVPLTLVTKAIETVNNRDS